jgi:hypothetical protein
MQFQDTIAKNCRAVVLNLVIARPGKLFFPIGRNLGIIDGRARYRAAARRVRNNGVEYQDRCINISHVVGYE